jgi:hypothetical protein
VRTTTVDAVGSAVGVKVTPAPPCKLYSPLAILHIQYTGLGENDPTAGG